ncbi:MAG: hypothetical protein AB7V48_09750 [Sedimentibacter sp.]
MEELLKEKLEVTKELRSFTKQILDVSLKTEYDKVNSMIEERQEYIDKINKINEKIIEIENKEANYTYSKDTRIIKKEIRLVFSEISDMDNLIRKNINNELKNVKSILIQPESTKLVNIKA